MARARTSVHITLRSSIAWCMMYLGNPRQGLSILIQRRVYRELLGQLVGTLFPPGGVYLVIPGLDTLGIRMRDLVLIIVLTLLSLTLHGDVRKQ